MARKVNASKAVAAETKTAPDADVDAEPAPTGDDSMTTDTNTADAEKEGDDALQSTTSPLPSAKKSVATGSSSKKVKHQFPPPFPDLIYGYHANDVLSGRGATINVHPGNTQFRDTCASRKAEFDSAKNVQKREIALEIVHSVLEMNPPGRFLERANDREDDDAEAYFREVDVDEVLTGSNAEYFNEKGLSPMKNRKLMKELGPWRDMGMEKAIQKVCAVIRDHKRPDRIALKAMGMLKEKKKGNKMTNADNVSSNCC